MQHLLLSFNNDINILLLYSSSNDRKSCSSHQVNSVETVQNRLDRSGMAFFLVLSFLVPSFLVRFLGDCGSFQKAIRTDSETMCGDEAIDRSLLKNRILLNSKFVVVPV